MTGHISCLPLKFVFHHSLSQILFIPTLNVCSVWCNTFRKISPIKYEDMGVGEDSEYEHEHMINHPVFFSKYSKLIRIV